MTRTLQDASERIFGRLVETAKLAGYDCEPGPRWFRGSLEDRTRAASLKVSHSVQFSRHRAIVHLEADDQHFVGLIGFESEEFLLPGTTESEIEDPMAFVLLAETDVAPTKSGAEVYNVVGVSKATASDYDGHAPADVKSLFPTLRVLRVDSGIDSYTAWPLFLRIGATECAEGNSWMTRGLSEALSDLADAQMDRFPYEALCRSVFDIDPRSLFLAIYRCLEALQAFDACSRLRTALAIDTPWYVLAEKLGQELAWYPKQSALSGVLSHVSSAYLEPLRDALEWESGESLAAGVANALTSVRNRIVHFTPPDKAISVDSYDWNAVCAAFARMVGALHQAAFSLEPERRSTSVVLSGTQASESRSEGGNLAAGHKFLAESSSQGASKQRRVLIDRIRARFTRRS